MAIPCHNIPEFCNCQQCVDSRAYYKITTGQRLPFYGPEVLAELMRMPKPDLQTAIDTVESEIERFTHVNL